MKGNWTEDGDNERHRDSRTGVNIDLQGQGVRIASKAEGSEGLKGR